MFSHGELEAQLAEKARGPMTIDGNHSMWISPYLPRLSKFWFEGKAELWLCRPALGLNGVRPIDLLQSPEGKLLVQELLGRLEYGVYI